ncbi:hypothetical protein [Staphylococcus epidermidis]|uniref:hypothetical protein n=1 Tax=Staphylococcus epidermidis TaxID=1282 RepID=UPI00114FD7EE|nr:hypothetical protein [Staphylococcus epidermidis]KAB2195431.1 hypothetical protein F9B22_13450 [Staphylococcus epidermidis]KAB2285869.1 hypothetical protein F9B57_10450 [Staphylococcus epidermidis]KAB2292921.1 hypothetical protein F9B62_11995 [Staphylococcus epidermidis]MCW7924787.1 hypothetical protein [Staphylococcus epidermidis]MCW7935055.1 hypothetical protein [Staphylococcus epidermidis]
MTQPPRQASQLKWNENPFKNCYREGTPGTRSNLSEWIIYLRSRLVNYFRTIETKEEPGT